MSDDECLSKPLPLPLTIGVKLPTAAEWQTFRKVGHVEENKSRLEFVKADQNQQTEAQCCLHMEASSLQVKLETMELHIHLVQDLEKLKELTWELESSCTHRCLPPSRRASRSENSGSNLLQHLGPSLFGAKRLLLHFCLTDFMHMSLYANYKPKTIERREFQKAQLQLNRKHKLPVGSTDHRLLPRLYLHRLQLTAKFYLYSSAHSVPDNHRFLLKVQHQQVTCS